MEAHLADLVELGDPDELLREVDRRIAASDWDALVELAARCRSAVDRGRQLWGVAAHIDYRLALEAPGRLAGTVVGSDATRFALGPLPEVAASTHTWRDMASNIAEGPWRGLTAFERVVRGEDLRDEPDLVVHVAAFELPLVLEPWEPRYVTADYRAKEARFPAPSLEVVETVTWPHASWQEVDEPEALDGLRDLVAAWSAESNGEVTVVAVDGGVAEALAALEVHDATADRLTPQSALAWMGWAGASGGAHGRRAGAAQGRAKAWWALAGVAGLSNSWPVASAVLGDAVSELQWWTWNRRDLSAGWLLDLVVVDPVDDVAFAISASDRA